VVDVRLEIAARQIVGHRLADRSWLDHYERTHSVRSGYERLTDKSP
jgi:hypothetical protein